MQNNGEDGGQRGSSPRGSSPRRWNARVQVNPAGQDNGRPLESAKGPTPRAFLSREEMVANNRNNTVIRVTSPRTNIRFIPENSDSFGSDALMMATHHRGSAGALSPGGGRNMTIGDDGFVLSISPRGSTKAMDALETGNLMREEDGLLASGKVRGLSTVVPRDVNMFWIEKFMVIIDCCQAYSLLWNISTQWPWPTYWLNFTYYMAATSIDLFTFETGVPDHGEPNQMYGYLGYATMAVLIPAGVFLAAFVINATFHLTLPARSRLFLALDLFCHTVFIPVGLAIGRLTACTAKGRMVFDHRVDCPGGTQGMVSLYSFIAFLAFAVVYPLTVMRRIKKGTLYDRPPDHETYIQGIEIEYMTKLSKEWEHSHLWLFSSFHRQHSYYWVYHMYYKLALVLISWLSWNDMQGGQAFLFWFVVIQWTSYNTLAETFRCRSTKTTACLVNWTLFIMSLFGMLTGNQAKSAFVVASTQTILLILFGSLGTLALLVHLGYLVFAEKLKDMDTREEWPSNRTYRRLMADHDVLGWISAIKAAQGVIRECALHPPELAPMHEVEANMSKVHECWIQARRRGSIMENVLRITLDEMASVHRRYRGVSLLPGKNDKVVNTLKLFSGQLKNRDRVQTLMNTKKRRLLFKILAMRLWVGERDVAKANNLEEALKMDNKANDEGAKSWLNIKRLAGADSKETAAILAVFEDLPYLQGKTEQLLAAPDPALRDSIITCRNAWKKVIRHWESTFESQFGHKPTIDDKETKRLWYEAYKACATQVKA